MAEKLNHKSEQKANIIRGNFGTPLIQYKETPMGITQSAQLLNDDFFFLNQVDHAEWYRIVIGHFQTHRLTKNCLVMFKSDKSKLLMIEFDNPHRISSVTPVGMTVDELETIRRDIKDQLVDNQRCRLSFFESLIDATEAK